MNKKIILFILGLILFNLFFNYDTFELFANLKFCNRYKLSNAYRDSFLKHDINLYHGDNWDMYYPCGYSNVENELKNLNINDKRKIFAIDGCDKIVSKNNLWKILIEYYGRFKAKNIMPESFLITEYKEFLNQYKINEIYILKKNLQRKEGLLLTNNLNKIKYSINNGYKIIQKYINNPFLINNRKINLRMYLLIVCNKNLNFYFHTLGKCIYTNKDYILDDLNLERNITSLNIDNTIYNYRPETLGELKVFIGKDKYNNLINNIRNITRMCCNSIKPNLCNSNNLKNTIRFQLFGLDYIIDDKMKPYLLEINKGPNMSYKSNNDKKLKSKVMSDIIFMLKLDKIPKNYNNGFIKLL